MGVFGRVRARAAGFGSDSGGGVAVIFALSATALVSVVGGGIDYARLVARKTQQQGAVDAGVLAGGNALKLAASTLDSVRGVTEQTVREHARPVDGTAFTLSVEVPAGKTSVEARAQETIRLTFGALVGARTVTVSAQARVNVVGKMRLCMLALDPAAPGSFNLQKNAQVTAYGCSLYANSKNPLAMVGGNNAMARAETICSAGGYTGARANFAPTPQTQCPQIADPLQDRPAPPVGDCKRLPFPFNLLNLAGVAGKNKIDRSLTLEPGTYCGGMQSRRMPSSRCDPAST